MPASLATPGASPRRGRRGAPIARDRTRRPRPRLL